MIEHFENSTQQAAFIKQLLEKSDHPRSHTCIVARTNREISSIQEQLNNLGVATSVIQPNAPESNNLDAVKVATVHRVKGLEFDQLILASANEGLVPLSYALQDKGDEISLEDAETEERSLIYVAITRARKSAYILSYGKQSKLMT